MSEHNGKKQKEADKIKSDIQRFYQRFQKAETAKAGKTKIWQELDEFDRGEQWKNASIPPWVPKPVTNFIRFIRTIKRANLASAIPKAQFHPEYEEDKEQMSKIQKAYDSVWETSNVARSIRRSIDRSLLQGTAIAYVYTDDKAIGGKYYGKEDTRNQLFQGQIHVKRFPNANFFIDPDAHKIEDAKWIDTTESLPLSVIKETPQFVEYCKENKTSEKLKGLESDQVERSSEATGEIYNRDYKTSDGGQNIKGDEMVTLHTHWEKYYKGGKWHVDVTYYLRNTDFFLLKLEDVKPNDYPFAVLYDEEEENDFWGSSILMDILENQKIINKLQQTASILGVLHQNPQKVVFRESGINAQELARTGTLPGKVWTSNIPGDQAITTIQPMDIPRGLFELDDRTQNNITQMVGINEAYTGQSVGSLTTSTGVDSLIERATIRDKDKMIQIDEFVERISHLIVLNILYKWKDERPITTIAKNGQPQFDKWEPMDEIDADNLTWRVRSNVYAKAPMTQASRRQQADKLMQMQGQFEYNPPLITPEEWIKMQEFDDEQDILRRMEADRMRLEKEKAQNLSQQIAQIAEQLNQMVAQGMPEEEAMMMVQQQAQELLDQQSADEAKNGRVSGGSPQAESQAPKGTTNQVAMANMANGS